MKHMKGGHLHFGQAGFGEMPLKHGKEYADDDPRKAEIAANMETISNSSPADNPLKSHLMLDSERAKYYG